MKGSIMIQGTMSNAGKSVLAGGLCRVLKQDGYSVAPFKSQNMALNSFITKEGLEMGRAQVMQAEAAGIEPAAFRSGAERYIHLAKGAHTQFILFRNSTAVISEHIFSSRNRLEPKALIRSRYSSNCP